MYNQEYSRIKHPFVAFSLVVTSIISISLIVGRASSLYLAPFLFLIVVLAALHYSRGITIVSVVAVSVSLLFSEEFSRSSIFDFSVWLLRCVVFLICGLTVNYEFEKMRRIQRYTEERNAISTISHSLTSTLDLKKLTERVVDTIIELFSAHGCRIYLLKEETQELHVIACKEKEALPELMQQFLETTVAVGKGLVGWVAETGKPILSGDAERDPRSLHIPGTPYDDESVIAVPLQTDDKTYGVLLINRLELNAFDKEDLQLSQIFADQVSIALANAQLFEHVRRLSETDSLTGLRNSRSLTHLVNHLINQANGNSSSISMLFIDCDDFKSINDRFGHPTGDKFLHFFAQVLQTSLREEDIAIRYAGDEFVIILPNTDLPKARAAARRVMEDIGQHSMDGIPELCTTVSVGLAVYPLHAGSAEELIKHADDALYIAKRNGKNQLAVYLEEPSNG